MNRDSTAKTLINNPDPDPDRTLTNSPPDGSDQHNHHGFDRPTIPDVELEKEIGRGGMGVVYSGRQTYLDRRVAVKLLLVSGAEADDDYVKRFQREAKILAGLSHHHIVSCYSAGLTPKRQPYLVMEFIDGPNLKEWVAEHGPLTEDQSLRLVHELAMALSHAHEQSIIHRDVKPENVLLAKKEVVADGDDFPFSAKLVDLGLARPPRSQTELNLTVEGMVMGTPTTMAPEQFEDPDGVDFRADMYGLGCVLYYALTGNPAFTGRTIPQLVSAKMSGPIPNPGIINKQLSVYVCDLVKKLLAVKREERPATYQELISTCACKEGLGNDSGKRYVMAGLASGLAVVIATVVMLNGPDPAAQAETELVGSATTTVNTGESTSPASSAQAPVGDAVPKKLGAPVSLWQPAVSTRLQAWEFSDQARWVSSETNADGIAGIRGIISRPIPGNNWELTSTFALGNDDDAKTEWLRLGVTLPDESQVFVHFNNISAAIILNVERTFSDKTTPSEHIHNGQIPMAPVTLVMALDGQFLRVTINGIPLEKAIGLPAVPSKVFIETKGTGPTEVSSMEIRLSKGLVLK